MRLVLTRAPQDAERTRAKLERAGHTVLASPLLTIQPIEVEWPRGVVDGLVASSAHAFEALTNGPAPEARRLMPLFLVGERTRERARERGFAGAAVTASTGAALAATIGGNGQPPRRVVHLLGRDHKHELEGALAAAGWPTVSLVVYEAQAATHLAPAISDAIRSGQAEGVLHYSRRSAALFIALAERAHLSLTGLRHLCLSEDVAAPLREAECLRVDVAREPTETALLATLTLEAAQA